MELRDHRYATPEQEFSLKQLRRIGGGITNLAGWLFKKGIRYGSVESYDAIEWFSERFNYWMYYWSIKVGEEKGDFIAFSKSKYVKSPFVKRMIKKGLKFNNMRNVCVTSIAPTGTLSTQFSRSVMSYGIEPPFGKYYWKRNRSSGQYKYFFCVPNAVIEYMNFIGHPIKVDGGAIEDDWHGSRGKSIAELIDKYCDIDIGSSLDTHV